MKVMILCRPKFVHFSTSPPLWVRVSFVHSQSYYESHVASNDGVLDMPQHRTQRTQDTKHSHQGNCFEMAGMNCHSGIISQAFHSR
jgi:hypothetical protein